MGLYRDLDHGVRLFDCSFNSTHLLIKTAFELMSVQNMAFVKICVRLGVLDYFKIF